MPRTNTNQTWDADGNLVHEETVEVPDEVIEQEQAATRLAELRAKGWANLTSAEKSDLVRLFFYVG